MTFGENVRARRLELGMTLQQVADYFDATRGYIWQIETDNVGVGLMQGMKLASALKTNVYVLAGYRNYFTLDKPGKKRKLKK